MPLYYSNRPLRSSGKHKENQSLLQVASISTSWTQTTQKKIGTCPPLEAQLGKWLDGMETNSRPITLRGECTAPNGHRTPFPVRQTFWKEVTKHLRRRELNRWRRSGGELEVCGESCSSKSSRRCSLHPRHRYRHRSGLLCKIHEPGPMIPFVPRLDDIHPNSSKKRKFVAVERKFVAVQWKFVN